MIEFCDRAGNYYFVRALPTNIAVGSDIVKAAGYSPGYYLTAAAVADVSGAQAPYYTIYNNDGVPVWYHRTSTSNDISGNPQPITLLLGDDTNSVVTLDADGAGSKSIIDVGSLQKANFVALPDSRGLLVTPSWNMRESHVVAGPAARKGNMMFFSYYDDGFYIQEISRTTYEIVWEYFSVDELGTPGSDYFDINSVDVHPITGDVLCSFREPYTIAAIDYTTKEIIWAIDPLGLFDAVYTGSGFVSLVPTDEPSGYNGTRAQHDARWQPALAPLTAGNAIVSVYDNGTALHAEGSSKVPRGVIYEIDISGAQALHRSSVFSPSGGVSGDLGSYTVVQEPSGAYAHTVDFGEQHPVLVEFSDISGGVAGTQNVLFEMDLSGNHYRIRKATTDRLALAAMRDTSGMPYTTTDQTEGLDLV
jgi:hypothetical protein